MFFLKNNLDLTVRKTILVMVFLSINNSLVAEAKKDNSPKLAKTYYSSTDARKALPKTVMRLLKKYKISSSNISVYIRDLNSSTAMLEHNVDTLRTPASTMKLLTTYAALKKLGPNFSWRTEVWARGDIVGDTLNGDLILKGFGDPFFVNEHFWKLIKALRDKGLKKINGDVIIDQSYFDLPEHDSAAFDGKGFRVYNAPSSALMFNFQATRFLFKPKVRAKPTNKSNKNKTKGSIEIVSMPKIEFDNEVKLVSGKCKRSHFRPKLSRDSSGKLTIRGKYAAACKQNTILRLAASHPSQHVGNAFKEFWSDLQGRHQGSVKLGKVSEKDEIFYVYNSPTLGEQMRLINKWSNNVMTKQLLLTLGAKAYEAPATWIKGQKAILETMQKHFIDTDGIKIENGSGLSRSAKITARQMGELLEVAFRDPMMPEFMSSLSLTGVDGTLASRFRNDDIRGRSHLKTGTLDAVTSIAGYMLNRQGKRLVVVVQHNGKRTGAGRGERIQNALLRWSFEQ